MLQINETTPGASRDDEQPPSNKTAADAGKTSKDGAKKRKTKAGKIVTEVTICQ